MEKLTGMSSRLETSLLARLQRIRERDRFRELRSRGGIDLSSNDYLGLTDHPRIREAVARALAEGLPLGAGGSRLLRGNTPWHEEMERDLATFKGTEASLIFNSGYDANVGVIATLCGAGDMIYADALVHASMIDGIRASKAQRQVFDHNDMDHLGALLAEGSGFRERFILVESLYSMDGDRAPLQTLVQLARRYDAHLIVDEAHATGVFGERGAGLLEEAGCCDAPLIALHTCGKAWGGFGAFIACSQVVKDYLVNHCRRLIFTTALPPLLLVHWRAVLELMQSEPWRRSLVLERASQLRSGLRDLVDLGASDSQIVPVILGEERLALAVAGELQAEGFDIRAIRPPSVPKGSSRLRIAVNARLREPDLNRLIAFFQDRFGSASPAGPDRSRS